MSDALTETLVRVWLSDHAGKVYCAECIGQALGQPDVALIRATMDALAHQQIFWAGPCLCGGTGLRYGW